METITRVETFLVAPRWLFVRVETSGGLVGWGEASCEGRSETVRTAVHQLAEYLIGQDPFRIEDHWQVMSKGSFYRHGVILSSAVAGLDQALWDLLGKSVGLPVHVLLGGPVRDELSDSADAFFGNRSGQPWGPCDPSLGGAVARALVELELRRPSHRHLAARAPLRIPPHPWPCTPTGYSVTQGYCIEIVVRNLVREILS